MEMRSILSDTQAIARVNPSASGIINQGTNPVAFCDSIRDEQKNHLISILSILGKLQLLMNQK